MRGKLNFGRSAAHRCYVKIDTSKTEPAPADTTTVEPVSAESIIEAAICASFAGTTPPDAVNGMVEQLQRWPGYNTIAASDATGTKSDYVLVGSV